MQGGVGWRWRRLAATPRGLCRTRTALPDKTTFTCATAYIRYRSLTQSHQCASKHIAVCKHLSIHMRGCMLRSDKQRSQHATWVECDLRPGNSPTTAVIGLRLPTSYVVTSSGICGAMRRSSRVSTVVDLIPILGR